MSLSLAEKALLLLYGTEQTEPQKPARRSGNIMTTSDEAEPAVYGIVTGALVMDAITRQHIRLKRSALFVRCRLCYLVLVFTMLFLALLILLGPAIAGAARILSFASVVAISIGLLLLWYVVFIVTAYLISGRLFIEETSAQDEALALVLQRMRETGQGKTCQTYFRRLAGFADLRDQVRKIHSRLIEQGYVVSREVSEGIGEMSQHQYTMNLAQPACRALQDTFRAFLLSGDVWDEHSATLAILLAPRILTIKPHEWPQRVWFTCFTPAERPVLRARLKAIKTQRDQVIWAQFGVAIHQALLTVRNLLPG